MKQYIKLSELQKRRREIINVPSFGDDWACPQCQSKKFDVDYTTEKDKGILRVRICRCGKVCETFEKILKWRK